MKIISIVGARPQFIKLAPLSKVLRTKHEEIVVHTGQHYDFEMSEIFFKNLNIPKPDYNLEVGSGSHAVQTANAMIRLEEVLISEKPDLVLVFGDTNSTVAASLTAAKLNMPSAHVEAGLRNFDRHYPEEINRIMSDHLAILNFAPTKPAMEHLSSEGLEKTAKLTGDVMLDVLHQNIDMARKMNIAINKFNLSRKEYNLITIHRPDNADDPTRLKKILRALNRSNMKTIFPAHPRVAKTLRSQDFKDYMSDNIILIEPAGYLDFISLLEGANKVITDSGGVQKDAYNLKTPCITLLENTPWTETVEDGWNILVKSETEALAKAINEFKPTGPIQQHYGDGQASIKISEEIEKWSNS